MRETLGLRRSADGHYVLARIPPGALIQVLGASPTFREMVTVEWGADQIEVFEADLRERSEVLGKGGAASGI